jgi:hypothetical protein
VQALRIACAASDNDTPGGMGKMNGTKKPLNDKFKVKKPIKIRYASHEEVSAATDEIIRQHSRAFELLAKS